MRLSRAVLVGAALTVIAACSKQDPATDRSGWITIHGYVENGAIENGLLWFKFQQRSLRFVAEAARTDDADAILSALKEASVAGRSVYVRFDPDDSELDAESGLPTYVVRELSYDGKQYTGDTRPRPRTLGRKEPSAEEAAVLRAIALVGAWQYADARTALDQALGGNLDDPRFRLLAVRTRGEAIEGYISDSVSTPDARDSALVAALADYEQWISLERNNNDAHYAAARVLSDLGAYDEAVERYHLIARQWPDEHFWTTIRIGAIHRIRGEHDSTLQLLDDLERKLEGQRAMPVHYHRAMTLNKVGRFAEAIAELGKGIEAQPDYMWAFLERACSYAQLGRIREAAADQKQGLEKLRALSQELTSPAARHNLDNAARIERELEGRLAAGNLEPTPAPCDGYWESGETRREKSPLLNERSQASPAIAFASPQMRTAALCRRAGFT